MKRRSILLGLGLAVVLVVAVVRAWPQTKTPAHVEVTKVAARPEDVGSIDAIIKATYETISGGVGVPRQWGRDQSLFDPNARLLAPHTDPKTGAVRVFNVNHQGFVDAADPSMVSEGFVEHEIGRSAKQYGNVATVLSSYEGKLSSTGKLEARGVNIFTLYNDGSRWWILSIIWDEERTGNPLPADLQPKS
jgi:hypothetical protein